MTIGARVTLTAPQVPSAIAGNKPQLAARMMSSFFIVRKLYHIPFAGKIHYPAEIMDYSAITLRLLVTAMAQSQNAAKNAAKNKARPHTLLQMPPPLR